MENSAAMSASQFQQVSEAMRGALDPGMPILKKAKVSPPGPKLVVPSLRSVAPEGPRAGKAGSTGEQRSGGRP